MAEDFFINLRNLREKAKLTQVEMAERVGITQGNVSRMERNHYTPSLTVLWTVVRVLNEAGVSCTLDDLIVSADNAPKKLNLTPQIA